VGVTDIYELTQSQGIGSQAQVLIIDACIRNSMFGFLKLLYWKRLFEWKIKVH
jgi:hypothetical protein